MKIKKISMSPPAILSVFLLIIGVLFVFMDFMELQGYIFMPGVWILLNVCSIVPIILITGNRVESRDITKASAVFSVLLPLIAIFFCYVSKEFFIIFICALICGRKLFFIYVQDEFLRKILGRVYSAVVGIIKVIAIPFLVIFFMGNSCESKGDGNSNSWVAFTVKKSVMSPNAVYSAEVIDADAGATGGSTRVEIIPQTLFAGVFKKPRKIIYYGKWGEAFSMTLRWETDEILYINETKYIIKDVM